MILIAADRQMTDPGLTDQALARIHVADAVMAESCAWSRLSADQAYVV
jgi:hypothetical protein